VKVRSLVIAECHPRFRDGANPSFPARPRASGHDAAGTSGNNTPTDVETAKDPGFCRESQLMPTYTSKASWMPSIRWIVHSLRNASPTLRMTTASGLLIYCWIS